MTLKSCKTKNWPIIYTNKLFENFKNVKNIPFLRWYLANWSCRHVTMKLQQRHSIFTMCYNDIVSKSLWVDLLKDAKGITIGYALQTFYTSLLVNQTNYVWAKDVVFIKDP